MAPTRAEEFPMPLISIVCLLGFVLVDFVFDHTPHGTEVRRHYYLGQRKAALPWSLTLPLLILIGTATLVLYMKRHGNRNDFLAAAASLPGLAIFGGVLIPAQNVVADPTAAAGRVAENLEVIRLWHYPLAAFIAVAVYFSARAQQAGLGGRPKND